MRFRDCALDYSALRCAMISSALWLMMLSYSLDCNRR